MVAPELRPRPGETPQEREARIEALVSSRVPDIRSLLDFVLDGRAAGITPDAGRIGLVGHSLGGWTVLAAPQTEPRVRAVVAMAPGGDSDPRPGVLKLPLTFAWKREVSVLYLAAECDVPIPVTGVIELYDRTTSAKRLVILRRADHQHFADDVEASHEAIRAASLPGDAAWIPAAMRPIAELATGEQAHLFTRGLCLAHMDAALRDSAAAARFCAGDLEAELAGRGIEAVVHG